MEGVSLSLQIPFGMGQPSTACLDITEEMMEAVWLSPQMQFGMVLFYSVETDFLMSLGHAYLRLRMPNGMELLLPVRRTM